MLSFYQNNPLIKTQIENNRDKFFGFINFKHSTDQPNVEIQRSNGLLMKTIRFSKRSKTDSKNFIYRIINEALMTNAFHEKLADYSKNSPSRFSFIKVNKILGVEFEIKGGYLTARLYYNATEDLQTISEQVHSENSIPKLLKLINQIADLKAVMMNELFVYPNLQIDNVFYSENGIHLLNFYGAYCYSILKDKKISISTKYQSGSEAEAKVREIIVEKEVTPSFILLQIQNQFEEFKNSLMSILLQKRLTRINMKKVFQKLELIQEPIHLRRIFNPEIISLIDKSSNELGIEVQRWGVDKVGIFMLPKIKDEQLYGFL